MIAKKKLVEMVKGVQANNADAAAELYDTFRQDIYYFIKKTVNDPELAADLTQDTFIEILTTIDKLETPEAFVTWSRNIAYHRCTAHFRKRQDLLVDEDQEGYSIFDTLEEERDDFLPGAVLEREQLQKAVQEMIDQLPEAQRATLMLYYFDELPVKQIAKIQGKSENTIKVQLRTARLHLEKSVNEYEKKNGVKLRCAGVVPLLLLLARQSKRVAAASAITTTSAAAGAATAAATHLGTKIAAGVAAALLTVTTVGVVVHKSASEPASPTVAATEAALPQPTNQWIGYGTDPFPQFTRRFELSTVVFTEEKITGHLTVSELYDISQDSVFEGTGIKNEDGTITYAITFAQPIYMSHSTQYPEEVLFYDPATEKFSFADIYHVTLSRQYQNKDPLHRIENRSWSVIGKSGFCFQNEENHLFELDIETMTEDAICGTLTVSKDGIVEHTSSFSGRGYLSDEVSYYEILLDTPRTQSVWITEWSLREFWLEFDWSAEAFSCIDYRYHFPAENNS